MPNVISNVRLDFPEAHKVADLEGVKQDLLWVIEAGKRFQAIRATGDSMMAEAFCAAIIVRYGRANVKGERRCIPSVIIRALPSDLQQDHKFFMNLRHKFIAHSVNNYEENYCTAFFNNLHSANPVFNQISAQHIRTVALSIEEILRIVSLSEALLKEIEKQFKIEKEKVAEIVKQMPVIELINNKSFDSRQTRESAGKNRSRKVK